MISSIALAVLLNGLMMIPCRGICSGESAMAYFMITGFIAAYFVIGIIFSSLFSWVYFSLRGKGTAILLVALIILALLIGFGKFYYNGFCLTGDEGCYFERAFAAGDPTICERAWISESCYLAYARTQEDESFCDKYLNDGPLDGSYARSSCYSDFAIRKNDPELCKKVNMDWARSGCCSQVFNLEDIKDLTAEQKVACGMGL
ncbi:hypothetical protein HOA55_05135 [archaeon]|nr:hypothetical protein [archaeon]